MFCLSEACFLRNIRSGAEQHLDTVVVEMGPGLGLRLGVGLEAVLVDVERALGIGHWGLRERRRSGSLGGLGGLEVSAGYGGWMELLCRDTR